MAYVSNPLFGEKGIDVSKSPTDQNVQDWFTGKAAYDDIDNMFAPTFVDPGQTAIDSGAYQMGSQFTDQYGNVAAGQAGRSAAQMDTTQSGQMRSGQQDLLDMLSASARGEGPSVAEMQLQQGQARNVAAGQAMAASQAGVNPALAQRNAMQGVGQSNMATNQQAAMLRAQEMERSRAAYGQQLGAVRGQDMSIEQQNLQAQIQQQQMNDDMVKFYEDQGLSRDQAELAAAQEQQRLQNEKDKLALEAAKLESEDQARSQGGFMGAVGTVLGAISDVNAKKCIKKDDKDIDDFMDSLAAYSYEYTDKAKAAAPELTGDGKVISVMLQDAERTELGKEFVEENAGGSGFKGMNYGKNLGTMLASIARLNEKVNALGDK